VNRRRGGADEGGDDAAHRGERRSQVASRSAEGATLPGPMLLDGDAPDLGTRVKTELSGRRAAPVLVLGDALAVLRSLPDDLADCCITSPPYYGHRRYAAGGLGAEDRWQDYVDALTAVTAELRRVLKPTGSFWLNLGDTYRGKCQLGIPWRVAFRLADDQGWTLRNSVVWHKVKGGPDTSRDRLRNVHELLFHFVRRPKGYHYDADAVRSTPRSARVENGAVVSATGVSGVRYRRQIELSTALSDDEKTAATVALKAALDDVRAGRLTDFRMVLRGRQRPTHSDVGTVSGRARELEERGFYFLRYHPGGAKPGDVWDILPEDSQGRGLHFAPFPADLCRIPILATCPAGGVVLDPFCGTGTALAVAGHLGRKAVGIDLAEDYLALAAARLSSG
jgi:DNA modification methylase